MCALVVSTRRKRSSQGQRSVTSPAWSRRRPGETTTCASGVVPSITRRAGPPLDRRSTVWRSLPQARFVQRSTHWRYGGAPHTVRCRLPAPIRASPATNQTGAPIGDLPRDPRQRWRCSQRGLLGEECRDATRPSGLPRLPWLAPAKVSTTLDLFGTEPSSRWWAPSDRRLLGAELWANRRGPDAMRRSRVECRRRFGRLPF